MKLDMVRRSESRRVVLMRIAKTFKTEGDYLSCKLIFSCGGMPSVTPRGLERMLERLPCCTILLC